ncbi:hypothetical protein ACOSP6_06120 [Tenacibaculum sp. MEBiC06402]|uniref:hypothetical protein n=1 Tax=unclassified Tenacibaculum TaxID=2635139 RepID=UPI003B9BB3C2
MKRVFIALVASFIVFMSCTKNEDNIDFNPNNLLLGHWKFETSKYGETVFKRTSSLPSEEYGVSFLEEGKYIERTSGFCATPPLSYWSIEGTYEVESEIIKVLKEHYPNSFIWKIELLTNEKLVVSYAQSDQEKDYEDLMDLFTEIYNLANSVDCTDANNWLITQYGSKACGGPQGYIAYPNSIDVNLFLEKVSNYTQKEHEYNIKWSIVSTCDVVAQPNGVDCENGKPVLTY